MKPTLIILLLLVSSLISSCSNENTKGEDIDNVYLKGIITIDSCEYLRYSQYGIFDAIEHKGNCKNCIERNKQK